MGLNGSGAGLGATTVSNLSPPTVGAVCYWIRFASVTGTQRFVAIGDDWESRGVDDTVYFDYGHSGTSGPGLTGWVVGTLYYVMFNYSVTAGTSQPFVNGTAYTGSTNVTQVTSGTMCLFDRPGSSDPTDCDLHDVRVYSRNLSLAEHRTIYYSRGTDSIVEGLLHRWPMNESPSGTTLSGTGTVKDIGSGGLNISADTNPPTYIYDASLSFTRRRAA